MKKSKLLFTILLAVLLFCVFCVVSSAKAPPSGIYAIDETISGKCDGEILNVSDQMEYRLASEREWKKITDTELTGLAAGKYEVRYRATLSEAASESVEVVINEGRKLSVRFYNGEEELYSYYLSYGETLTDIPQVPPREGEKNPEWSITDFSDITTDLSVYALYKSTVYSVLLPVDAEGYSVVATAGNMFVSHGEKYSFRVVIDEGYSRTEDFAIIVNGELFSRSELDEYTISSVFENTVIKVEGVKDITSPDVSLTIGDYSWQKIDQGENILLYTSKDGEIKLSAKDKGSGIDKKYIYISDFQLSVQELQDIYYWEEFEAGMEIPLNTAKFVYVKVTDKAQNVTYVGTDGIIFDNEAPVFNVNEDEIYYGKTSVTVTDVNIDKVYVDGKLASSSFSLIPRDSSYTLSATDKAGNACEITVSVKKAIPDYIIPMDLVATFGQTLEDIVLPLQDNGRFVWSLPLSTSVGDVGKNTFQATFIPNNTSDYQIVSGISITLSVSYYAHELPTGITTENETVSGKKDGAILGLKEGMEYRKDTDSEWIAASSERADGLGAGVYYVRYAATPTYQASAYVEAVIKSGSMLTVTFLVDGELLLKEEVSYGEALENIPSIPNKVGYNHTSPHWDIADFSSITSNITVNAIYVANTYMISFTDSELFSIDDGDLENPVKYGENYSFTIDIPEEYMQGVYFEVTDGETLMLPDKNGVYTLENITSVHNISITGIVKSVTADDIYIDGIYNKTYYAIGDKFVFDAVGAGLDNEEPSVGDERYTPVSWFAYFEGVWTEAPYSAYFTLYKEGDCSLRVEFEREVFDGEKWITYGHNVVKTHDFYVNKLPAGLPSGNSTLSTVISIILITAFTGAFVIWYVLKKKHK